MTRSILMFFMLVLPLVAQAQQGHVYRVGVLFHGGVYANSIDGLRQGLKESVLEESKQYLLHLRDTKGDLKSAAAAALQPGQPQCVHRHWTSARSGAAAQAGAGRASGPLGRRVPLGGA